MAKCFVSFVKIVKFLWIDVCHGKTEVAIAPFIVIMIAAIAAFIVCVNAFFAWHGGIIAFICAEGRILRHIAEGVSAALCIGHLPRGSSAGIFSGILQDFSTPFGFLRFMPSDILYAPPVRLCAPREGRVFLKWEKFVPKKGKVPLIFDRACKFSSEKIFAMVDKA